MTIFSSLGHRHLFAKLAALALAVVLASPLGTVPADARAGGGFSFGSRGSRTFSAPPPTATAPRSAQPFQYSETPRPGFNSGGFGAQPRRFGFGSGLAAGLLGAGLFGLLTGNGFFGGIGGLGSIFGLLFQLLLLYGVFRLAMGFFRNRAAGQTAGGGWFGQPGAAPGFGGAGPGPNRVSTQPIQIAPDDFGAFERSLSAIQDAYSREDLGSLSRLATPEMVRTFAADLQANASRGIHNTITGVQLHQGDLAEAWREGASDYASVAMRFGCVDVMIDRASGRIVQGDPNRPEEVTEIWTFRRDRGGPWLLSGIQQAS